MELDMLPLRSFLLCGALVALGAGCASRASPLMAPAAGDGSDDPPPNDVSDAAWDGPAAEVPGDTPDSGGPEAKSATAESSSSGVRELAPAQAVPPSEEASGQGPAPLPEGTLVLHIGDSFAGALGIDLSRELKEAGIRSVLRYEESSYIPTWAWSKELERYIWDSQPDLVLITLGANELEHPNPEERAATVQRLVRRLGDRPCVWIAPPLWEGARGELLEVIRDSCAPCVYMDTNALIPDLERAGDKIHPSTAARPRWARLVIEWLARQRDPSGERPWALKDAGGSREEDR